MSLCPYPLRRPSCRSARERRARRQSRPPSRSRHASPPCVCVCVCVCVRCVGCVWVRACEEGQRGVAVRGKEERRRRRQGEKERRGRETERRRERKERREEGERGWPQHAQNHLSPVELDVPGIPRGPRRGGHEGRGGIQRARLGAREKGGVSVRWVADRNLCSAPECVCSCQLV